MAISGRPNVSSDERTVSRPGDEALQAKARLRVGEHAVGTSLGFVGDKTQSRCNVAALGFPVITSSVIECRRAS